MSPNPSSPRLPRARISLGVNEYWRNCEGNEQVRIAWFNVVVLGRLAVNPSHLVKGAKVCIECRLRSDTNETDGESSYSLKAHADRVG